jgi:nucleoside-diphosphate-sugar epimerase
MTVLVTGANGFVGSHLVEGLLQGGHRVRGLVRRTSDLRWLENLDVERVYGEVTDSAGLPKAVRGMEAIYHTAGVTRARRPEIYQQVNHQGTVNLLRACLQHNPSLKKFILISSQAAAGPGAVGRLARETDPCRPVSDYGRSKLMAEQAAARYINRLPIVIIRPPAIYGPRDRDFLSYFKVLKKHLRPLLGLGRRRLSICHVRDVVRGSILAGNSSRSSGQVYFVSGQETSWDELTSLMARALGTWTVKLPVPRFVLQGAALVSELFAPLRREAPVLDRRKAGEMVQVCWTCDWSKAAAELGYEPTVSLEKGIGETVEWYRQAGWL